MTVKRWILLGSQLCDKVSYQRQSNGNYFKKSSDVVVNTVKLMLDANPLLTLCDLRNKIFDTFHFYISKSFLSSILKNKCKITRKKVKFYGKSEDQSCLDREFTTKRDHYLSQKKNFISLDETSFSRKGKDVYGYSVKGKKIHVQKTFNRLTSKSALSIIDMNGNLQYHIIDGAYNKDKFINALKQFRWTPNSVLLMDNIQFHKSFEVKRLMQENNIEILYTPPYSPWFNPIENVFSLVKSYFYKFGRINESFDYVKTKTNIIKSIFEKTIIINSIY